MVDDELMRMMLYIRTGHRCRKALPDPWEARYNGGQSMQYCPVCGLDWHVMYGRWEPFMDVDSGRQMRRGPIAIAPLAHYWDWGRFWRRK
ncbi:hypothetical protein GCM10011583_72680 [Streptomyces camponoticapitis]|uniref:Uncharacterized protein n=2 Tax=Streptomyces camponoticapitis TaxID=1616125 RepID=A0ABQ2F0B8_9ACTN|nr:hypothetical protein GCM10011583_72680 [Streptomyces camponoticapitis]